MIVSLQNNIDMIGNQEINPGFDTGFLGVTGPTGKVRMVTEGDRTVIRMGVEVLLQPGGNVAYTATARPATDVGKRNVVPASNVKTVRSVWLKCYGTLVASRDVTVKVLQQISFLQELFMVGGQDWVHLRNVRAPILIEIAVVFPHRAVIVLIVAQSEDEIGFGRLSRSSGGDR